MGKYLPNKTKTIYYPQKQSVRIVFNQEKLIHSRPHLRSLNALNVYQINLKQYPNFINKVSNNRALHIPQISYTTTTVPNILFLSEDLNYGMNF